MSFYCFGPVGSGNRWLLIRLPRPVVLVTWSMYVVIVFSDFPVDHSYPPEPHLDSIALMISLITFLTFLTFFIFDQCLMSARTSWTSFASVRSIFHFFVSSLKKIMFSFRILRSIKMCVASLRQKGYHERDIVFVSDCKVSLNHMPSLRGAWHS